MVNKGWFISVVCLDDLTDKWANPQLYIFFVTASDCFKTLIFAYGQICQVKVCTVQNGKYTGKGTLL